MINDKRGEQPRKILGGGAILLLIGLALVGTRGFDSAKDDAARAARDVEAGAYVTLIALVLVVFGIHSFGRLGPVGEGPGEGPASEPDEPKPARDRGTPPKAPLRSKRS